MARKKTHEQFVQEMREINPQVEIVGRYQGSNTKVETLCLKCNNVWPANPTTLIAGIGCPYCAGKRPIPGKTDFQTLYPELALEWHPSKNGNNQPSDYLPQSNERVWWLGKCGHEWKTTVASRTRGRGCPICSGNQVLPGFNDFASKHPSIAKQWHPTKNGKLTPSDVTSGSNRKVWWLCENGHEWQASPSTRAQGHGCPYCKGNFPVKGVNDFATLYPEMARQWNTVKNKYGPSDVTPGSTRPVWWICDRGHEWRSTPSSRTRTPNSRCPFCSNKRLLTGFNDLESTEPSVAAQWHPSKNGSLLPSMVMRGSNKKVWWKCPNGHEWQATVYSRTSNKTKCPYCSGLLPITGENDLETMYPVIASEWDIEKNDGALPSQFLPGSNRKVWWKCSKCKHEWQTSPASRTGRGTGCPKCAADHSTSFREQAVLFYLRRDTQYEIRSREQLPLNQKNVEVDIWIPERNIAIEYDGEYWHKNRKKKDSKKEELLKDNGIQLIRIIESSKTDYSQNRIEYSYRNKTNENLSLAIAELERQLGIKPREINIVEDQVEILEQYKQEESNRSLAAMFPEIASEWHPTKNGSLTPEKSAYGSSKVVWWQCSRGHEWRASLNSRTNQKLKAGCPICSNRKLLIGFNDLATVYPTLAKEWHPTKNAPLKPCDVVHSKKMKVWWKCNVCSHEWYADISTRTGKKRTGCPVCAGRVVHPGINDLQTINPAIAAEWHPTLNGDLTPSEVAPMSSKKVWWLGKCGHEWITAVANRSSGTGCPYCNSRKILKGFNDLKTKRPIIAAEWNGPKNGSLTPDAVMARSGKKVWWKCSHCGNEYASVIASMTAGTSGCRKCGYKPGLA